MKYNTLYWSPLMTGKNSTLPLEHHINPHSDPLRNCINYSAEEEEKHDMRNYTATVPMELAQNPFKAESSEKLRKIRSYITGTLITLNAQSCLLYYYHDCNTLCLVPKEDTLPKELLSKNMQNPDISHQIETRGFNNI